MRKRDVRRMQRYVKRNKFRRAWKRIAQVMACITVFCTTYALILPAITLEMQPFCEIEDHEHVAACYEPLPESGEEQQTNPLIHSHNDLCFDRTGMLICPLEEIEEHQHSDACYQIVYRQMREEGPDEEGQLKQETQIQEEVPTTPVHVHDSACYAFQQGVLICSLQESPGHKHEEDCYGEKLICQLQGHDEHAHTELCYETVLLCHQEETEGHLHTDTCYEMNEVLVCGLETAEALADTHTGTDTAQSVADGQEPEDTQTETILETEPVAEITESRVLVCQKQEYVEHSHSETCFATNEMGEKHLVCVMPQLQKHQHSEKCLSLSEEMLSCDLVEEAHKHTYKCYTTWSFVCEFCADGNGPQTDADLETEQDWEKTFADVTLTGFWPEDILSIAKTQLDYEESQKNYAEGEDGTCRGYTRYGQWRGDPYGDWNSLFVSFCLHYANVEEFPLQDNCGSWIEELKDIQRYVSAEGYIPKSGDLIFLESNRTERFEESEEVTASMIVDRVGIVSELVAPTETEPARILVIEGDRGGRVQEVSYDMISPQIIGYCDLPDGLEGTYLCGMENHSHGWICYDAEGALACNVPQHVHTETCKYSVLTYADDHMQAVLTLAGSADIPRNLEMRIVPVTIDADAVAYGAMFSAVGDTMYESPYFVNSAVFYRVELWNGEEHYQLEENVSTSLQISMMQPDFGPDSDGENPHLRAFALSEQESIQEITTAGSDEALYEQTVSKPESSDPSGEQGSLLTQTMTSEENLYAEEMEAAQAAANYQASEVVSETTEESEQGLSEIHFTAENTTVFGVALAATSQTDGFWQRVTNINDLSAGETYVIVSAEGGYALTGNTGTSGTKVNVEMVKGNPGYYQVTDSNGNDISSNDLLWQISGSGNTRTIYNTVSGYYVNLSDNPPLEKNSANLTFAYQEAEQAWTMSQSVRSGWFGSTTYYLTNPGDTDFVRNSNNTNEIIASRSMLIFKLVNTTLSIPDDVVTAPEIGGEGQTPQKPEYDPYQQVSDGKTGVTSHDEVEGFYYSDPATSQLEAQFTGDPADDGKILTDKSVIYGDDDYGAFDTYGPNTFGVTLSALGQEFLTGERTTIETPVDVMFILDISGSMNANTVDSQGTTRTEAMVEAVNFSIKEIMDQNPNNRVGAVLFSTGTGDLLEMGRYSHASNEYLKVSDTVRSWTTSGGAELEGYFVELNSGLTKDGQAYNHTIYQTQMNGTYTQAGIALGSQKLMNVPDTTCDVTVFEGTEQETTVKVQRQPVIILLSDGEPTHCTSNYRDVLSGPHYGDGQANTEYQGVYGYYTILSANYYKRMVGIHYNTPALFYSVGMGISADGDEGVAGVDGAHYKRTVLNPTAANVSRDSEINTTNTTTQLRNLLNSSYNGEYITVVNSNQVYMPEWMGRIHADVPVIDNPYAGNYSYADNAYFGNYDTDSLKDIFGQILAASKTVSPYGFILRSRTSMDMDDPIGEGMELKSDPVLSYGGTNYVHTRKITSEDGMTVSYYYDYLYTATDGSNDTADLSKIVVQVVTDSQGLQTVHMNVPDYVLPAYAPYTAALNEDQQPYFYYEALPVRLTYQVGLTEAAAQEVAELKEYGGQLVYYTNRYTDTQANAYFLPTNDNPYYNIEDDGSVDGHHGCHATPKTDNLTGTLASSFECHHGDVDHWENGAMTKVPSITQKQGNNGKLVFSAERKVIDIPVEKKWRESVPDGGTSVDIQLYSVVGDTITLVQTLTLSQENQWAGTFERLPLLEEGGYYALRELVPAGFAVSYTGEIVEIPLDGKPTRVVKIQGQNPIEEELVTVTNSHAYTLPSTGGVGTQSHTIGGTLLIAAAAWLYICTSGKNRKKGGRYGQ